MIMMIQWGQNPHDALLSHPHDANHAMLLSHPQFRWLLINLKATVLL